MEKIVSLKNVSKTFPVGKSLLGKPTKFVQIGRASCRDRVLRLV